MEAPPSEDPFVALSIAPTKELPLPMEFGSGVAVPPTTTSKDETTCTGSDSNEK